MESCGFSNLARVANGQQESLFFGANTVNNLPLLFEVKCTQGEQEAKVIYKVPVLPLKGLLSDAITHILARTD